MARICATCREPWPADCICDDDEPEPGSPQDGSDSEDPA